MLPQLSGWGSRLPPHHPQSSVPFGRRPKPHQQQEDIVNCGWYTQIFSYVRTPQWLRGCTVSQKPVNPPVCSCNVVVSTLSSKLRSPDLCLLTTRRILAKEVCERVRQDKRNLLGRMPGPGTSQPVSSRGMNGSPSPLPHPNHPEFQNATPGVSEINSRSSRNQLPELEKTNSRTCLS